jgi:TetR/AcrR family acrAB operon transcriptional repressor
MRESLASIQAGMRNAISKGQLPADMNVPVAASMVHAFISGSLKDMLFVPEVLDFGRHARQMVESMIDALRSPALRMGA